MNNSRQLLKNKGTYMRRKGFSDTRCEPAFENHSVAGLGELHSVSPEHIDAFKKEVDEWIEELDKYERNGYKWDEETAIFDRYRAYLVHLRGSDRLALLSDAGSLLRIESKMGLSSQRTKR